MILLYTPPKTIWNVYFSEVGAGEGSVENESGSPEENSLKLEIQLERKSGMYAWLFFRLHLLIVDVQFLLFIFNFGITEPRQTNIWHEKLQT